MSCKKVLLLVIVIVLIAVGVSFFLQRETVEAPLVGGDRDAHGCIGSAGYLWCEAKAECLRPFEEQWDESCGSPATGAPEAPLRVDLVDCTMDTKICLDGSAVGRSGPDCEFEKCSDEETE